MDTGENAYAMVLADDLDGDGLLELLLATMGGSLFAFGTHVNVHPLNLWRSQVCLQTGAWSAQPLSWRMQQPHRAAQVHGRSGFTARGNWVGIYATEASRAPRDVRGRSLSVQFRIQDLKAPSPGRSYDVAIRLEACPPHQSTYRAGMRLLAPHIGQRVLLCAGCGCR